MAINLTKEERREALKDFLRKNELEIDEYVIRDGKKHPFAVICPGGGYHMVCTFLEGKPYAEYLNSKGISAFVIRYRCKKKARFPAPMDDLAEAIRRILARADEYGLDIEDYSVWGSSAGGHLAASFGTETLGYAKYGLPKPKALVLVYPVVTMGADTHKGSRANLLGKKPLAELVELTSIEKQVTDAFPPSYIWCGDADKTVPPVNSQLLADALKSHGVRHELTVYEGVDHGVGLGKGLACEGWIDQALAFWMNH